MSATIEFEMPQTRKDLTGKTRGRFISFESCTSKFGQPQMKLDFLTEKQTKIACWFTLTSPREMEMLKCAGVIIETQPGKMKLLEMAFQPGLEATFQHGKIVGLKKLT